MSPDEHLRRLERAAAAGDTEAAKALIRQRIRSGDQDAAHMAAILDYEERLAAARAAGDHFAAVEARLVLDAVRDDMAGRHVTPPLARRIRGSRSVGARELWLEEAGRRMAPRAAMERLTEIAGRVTQMLPELAPRSTARADQALAENERFREQMLADRARRVRHLAAASPRATSWDDVAAVLARVEGRSSERQLELGDLVRLSVQTVRSMEVHETATLEADHGVSGSYRYPVAFTRAAATRLEDGDVLLTISRLQSWGLSGPIREASVVVPGDLLQAEGQNPPAGDAWLRQLEREAMSGDTEAEERLLVELGRRGMLWATLVSSDYTTVEVRLHAPYHKPRGKGGTYLKTFRTWKGSGLDMACMTCRGATRALLEHLRERYGARCRILELREKWERTTDSRIYRGAREWATEARAVAKRGKAQGIVGWNPD